MSFDYPVESFGFNFRDNGYKQDGFASTMWKLAHYIAGLSTIIAIFDLRAARQAYMAGDMNSDDIRDRARIALVPGLNLVLIPIDIFYTLGHIYNACLTAD
ncbi:MAG: hypothetical protein ACK4HV_00100 [Parachlamydiaceae bacterium]